MASAPPASAAPIRNGVLAFTETTQRLLNIEHTAEVAETEAQLQTRSVAALEARGTALRRLRLVGKRPALHGRTVVALCSARHAPDGSPAALPASRISSGDVVGVAAAAEALKPFCQGVVTRLTRDRIEVALDDTGTRGGRREQRKTARQASNSNASHHNGSQRGHPNATASSVVNSADAADSGDSSDDNSTPPAASSIRPANLLDSGWSGGLVLLKLANTVTHRLLCATAKDLASAASGESPRAPAGCPPCAPPAGFLLRLLYGGVDGSNTASLQAPLPVPAVDELPWANTALNASQQAAVRFALGQPDLAVIHGPPGTGKTTTVVELIVQHVRAGRRVLVAAASNTAVDNVAERLLAAGIAKTVRLGHPARLLASVQDNSLDALLERSEAMVLARDVRRDIDAVLAAGRKGRHGGRGRGRGHGRGAESAAGTTAGPIADGATLRELRKELRAREARAVAELLTRADVVCGTTATVARSGPLRHVPPNHFDVAVVDEAGQALEISCWSALLQAPRAVLAGDHLQLPPTVTSREAAAGGLASTLLDRVVALDATAGAVTMLDTQYRMHATIQGWSSDRFYDSRLRPAESVAAHVLLGLPGVTETLETAAPLWFVDTGGAGLSEHAGEDDISKANAGEAAIVVDHVEALLAAGVSPADVGVITPYNLQVELLRSTLAAAGVKGVEVNSVDGFQGREKEAIVMSLVRSNPNAIVGFLSDARRLNVAVTRARRHLCIVADSATVAAQDATLSSLVDYLCAGGETRTAHDYSHVLPQLGTAAGRVVKTARNVDVAPGRDRDTRTKREARAARSALAAAKREADNASRRAELQQHLSEFKAAAEDGSGPAVLDFSARLNAWERRTAHELCELLGLGHVSVGEGTTRHLRATAGDAAKAQEANAGEGDEDDEEDEVLRVANVFAALAGPPTMGDDDAAAGEALIETTRSDHSVSKTPAAAPQPTQASASTLTAKAAGKGEEAELSDVQRVLRDRAARLEAMRKEQQQTTAEPPLAGARAPTQKRKGKRLGGQRRAVSHGWSRGDGVGILASVA